MSREGCVSGRNVGAFREKCVKRERVSGLEEKEQERRMRRNCVRKCEYETYIQTNPFFSVGFIQAMTRKERRD